VSKNTSKSRKLVSRRSKSRTKLSGALVPNEELTKAQFTSEKRKHLRKKFGVERFAVVLNPQYKLPRGAKQYFLFVDNEGALGYQKAKEFLELDHPGPIALYYTVSWSEIVIQFCGTDQELLRYVQELVEYVRENTQRRIEFDDRKVIEGFWLETALFLHGEKRQIAPEQEISGLEKLVSDYEEGHAQKKQELYNRLEKRGVILGYSAVQDFVQQKRLRSIVLISYNTNDIQPPTRVFQGALAKPVMEAYTVKRAQAIGDYNGNSDYDSVQVLAVVEHQDVFEFRKWMDDLYRHASVNCLPFILAARIFEKSRNAGLEVPIRNIVKRFQNSDSVISVGSLVDPAGKVAGDQIHLKPSQLLGHTIMIGKMGSRKTSAMVQWVRSAVLKGIRVIALDVKGDLIGPAKFSVEKDKVESLNVESFLKVVSTKPWQEALAHPVTVVNLHGRGAEIKGAILKKVLGDISGANDLNEAEKERREIKYLVVIDEFHEYRECEAVTSPLLTSTMSTNRSKGVGLVLLGQKYSQFEMSSKTLLEYAQNWFFMCIEPSDRNEIIKRIRDQIGKNYQPYDLEQEITNLAPGKAFLVSAPDHASYDVVQIEFPTLKLR
jgi:hypothetical protein